MTSTDERIRNAYGPVPTDEAHRDRIWAQVLEPRGAASKQSRGWRAPHMLLAAAIAMISLGSIAAAQPGPIKQLFGGVGHADRMEVMQEPNPVGTKGLSRIPGRVFDQSEETGLRSVDGAALHKVLDYDGGRYRVKLRAAPSKDGQACMYQEVLDVQRKMVGGAAISCSLSMQYNGHVTVGSQRDIRMGTLVAGLADDDVAQVRVRLSNGQVPLAQMGKNAYLLHEPDPDVHVRGLLVDLVDGRTLDVTTSGCLRSQLEPARSSRLGCGFGMNKVPTKPER